MDTGEKKVNPSQAQLLWRTCKTIPTCVLENPDAEIDLGQFFTQTPPVSSSQRNAHLLIRQCTIGGTDDHIPRKPDYRLRDKIGQGACGLVYAACQNTIDREVAIKVIRPEIAQDELIKSLFLSEAVVTGDLDHPNIVPVYDLGKDQQNCLFYAMKKIKGIAWNKVLKQKTEAENIEILLRVCDAVAFAHDKGVVHRDLKPQNIMLGDYGEVYVMDWGIAVSPSGNGKAEILTPRSNQAGTPLYMAPEMAEAHVGRVNHLSDIYLLGGILYEIETGLTPHSAGNLKVCLRNAAGNVIQPTDKKSELIDIALKAMATEQARRYQSVAEFSHAIRDYQSHAQSIALCKSAAEIHAKAKKTNAYQDYLMALFSYENALSMWPDNPRATAAKTGVNLDYAWAAFGNKDYDLAISLLDVGNGAHQTLLDKSLRARQARQSHQERIRWLKIGSLMLVMLTLAIVTAGLFIVEAQRRRAVAAEKQMQIAQTAALQENYYNAIALAARKMGDQRYDQARTMLNKLPADLRGWEWGRLTRLCYLELVTFRGHERPIVAVAFSPDEQYIATADRDNTIKLWHPVDDREVHTYSVSSGKIEEIRFSPDSRRLVAINTDGLTVSWDIESGAVIPPENGEKGNDAYIFYSPDKQYYIKRTLENSVLIQSAEDNQPARWLQGHTETVYTAAFSPDSARVVTGGADKTAVIWDVATGRPLLALQGHTGSIQAVQFSPTGRYLLTGSADKTAKLWSARLNRDQIRFTGHKSFVSGVAFSPDNRKLATSSYDGTIKIWRIAGQKEERTLTGHIGRVNAVQFSPDGRFLISAGADDTAILWNADTGEIVFVFTGHRHSITAVDVSPDGRYAATGSWDRTIRLWDLSTRQEQATWKGHRDAVISIRFSPDGNWLVSGSRDHTAILWDTRTGKSAKVLAAHSASVHSVDFSRDGRLVATAGWDNTIKIWDAATGRQRRTFSAHTGSICAVAFADNGRRLISAGWDKSVKIWDTQSGQELLEQRGHSAPIVALAVSPDGRMVATGGNDQTAIVWETAPYAGAQASSCLDADAMDNGKNLND